MNMNKNIENTEVETLSKVETRSEVETPNERRKALTLASVALGVTVAAPTAWFKPVVNAVILPSHADTSPDEPGECPLLDIGNVTVSDVISGAEPCTISFEVLSADPGVDVTVINITNSATTDTITYDAFGNASDTLGPRVIWAGSPEALDCAVPAEDITFMVTYTCDEDNVNGAEFTAEFLLSEIGALAL